MESRTPTSERRGQEGFTLAALIVILTVISIVIAYTVPEQWSIVLKRDRDRQTIFLMKQYARGIRAWRVKNQAMPTSLQQLQDARQPRLLRGTGKWPCPLTGKEDDWILVPPTAVAAATANQPPPPPNQPPQVMPPSKLIPELSPPDYTGPFVGVRPKFKGKSYVTLNGAENYEEWVYTVQDLESELALRQLAMQKP